MTDEEEEDLMNPTIFMMIVASEQKLLHLQTERDWQRQQAVRRRARRDRDELAALRLCLHGLVQARARGTLAIVMPATARS